MRYIDTGARDPDHALGVWLAEIGGATDILSLRFQSGFFSAEALGSVAGVLAELAALDGTVHIVVGSNDGVTRRADLEALLQLAGPPRRNLRLGLVAFENAYFHPKTLHVSRVDGSEAAYVGSANLTAGGVASLHVEAGMILDTRDGDPSDTLDQIRAAIDWWFDTEPAGLRLIFDTPDIDGLVAQGLVGVARPSPTSRSSSTAANGGARLAPLVALPALPDSVAHEPLEANGADGADRSPRTVQWSKRLSRSDAQRKPRGNQRGGITLVAAGYPINPQTYFRHDFFGGVGWSVDATRTGQGLERAVVRFDVSVLDRHLGALAIPITHAPNREAAQANYTTMLHLGPLAPYFASDDLTNRSLLLERTADGSFQLTIS